MGRIITDSSGSLACTSTEMGYKCRHCGNDHGFFISFAKTEDAAKGLPSISVKYFRCRACGKTSDKFLEHEWLKAWGRGEDVASYTVMTDSAVEERLSKAPEDVLFRVGLCMASLPV